MISMKHVLVATDFSDASAAALKYGREFAMTFDATLHLLHVIDAMTLDYYGWTAPQSSPAMIDLRAHIEQHAREQLEGLLNPDERGRLNARLELIAGSPFVEIIRYAKRESIDLIVIGTHGRGPIAHMLMGGVAEKVVRKASCPVLTVRHPEHEFVMP